MIRIVVAEDQTLVLGALATLLGFEPDLEVVGKADNGPSALALVHELTPNILLTDIEMPGMSGIEVAQAIYEQGLSTRVVIATFGRPGYLRRAQAAGVRGYLLKDTPSEQLADAIRKVAAGGRAIDADLASTAWEAGEDPLNDRERSALRLAEEGFANKEIARRLSLSPGTVRNYLSEAASKLGATNRIEASRMARARGWL